MRPMIDEDTQPDEIGSLLIPLPLCDDEDEPVASAQVPSEPVLSDKDVEGHGAWGVGDTA